MMKAMMKKLCMKLCPMGNSDAHGKNISILHGRESRSLAPYYDLICTRAYERLDRKLAMACGRQFDPDLIGPDDLKMLAQDTGVTFRFLRTRLQRMWEGIHVAMDQARSDFEAQGFDGKLIQQVEQALQKIHRGLAKRLGL
jgi:serine/threonine-protein kinase HipA